MSTINQYQNEIPYPVNNSRGGISLQNWGEHEKFIKIHYRFPGEDNIPSNLLTIYQKGVRDVDENRETTINDCSNDEKKIEGDENNNMSNESCDGIIGSYIWASSVVVSR